MFLLLSCVIFLCPSFFAWCPLLGIFSQHFSCTWHSPNLLIVSCSCLCLPTFNLSSPSVSISGLFPFFCFPLPLPQQLPSEVTTDQNPPAFQREYFFRPSNPQILIEAQKFSKFAKNIKIPKNSQKFSMKVLKNFSQNDPGCRKNNFEKKSQKIQILKKP